MKVYEVERREVITLVEDDMKKAGLDAAALVMHNPCRMSVRAVHERNVQPGPDIQAGKIHNKFPFFVSTGNLAIRV
jgi:hypothetical protein